MPELTLEVTREMAHAPERVFDAWLNPDLLAKFMIAGPGMRVPEASSEAREGGRFRILMQAPDDTILPHEGEYLTIDRPRRLVFTWVSPYSVEDSTVTLDFEPLSGGGTRVRLSHVRFATEDARDAHRGGWSLILEALEGAL